jgi:hypothetical protein
MASWVRATWAPAIAAATDDTSMASSESEPILASAG